MTEDLRDPAIEQEHDRQRGRFAFRLYDAELERYSTDDEFVRQALHVVAEVPRRWLPDPLYRLAQLARAEDEPEVWLNDAAAKLAELVRSGNDQIGVMIWSPPVVDVRRMARLSTSPLLVAMLRARLIKYDDVVHYRSWLGFSQWIQSWIYAPNEVKQECHEELWRLSNVYDVLALDRLGSGNVPRFVWDYIAPVLQARFDNGLRTYITTSVAEELLANGLGFDVFSLLAEMPAVAIELP